MLQTEYSFSQLQSNLYSSIDYSIDNHDKKSFPYLISNQDYQNNGGLDTKNNIIYASLMEFYGKEENMERFLKIIQGQSKVSLRIIDWFVTNYAKKNDTCIISKDGQLRLKVYNEYKAKLNSYNKRQFDPFCRWDRQKIHYKEDMYIETTLGQMNFFKWILQNDIIQYIDENYHTIYNDMKFRGSMSKRKENSEKVTMNKTRKKREELSVSETKNIKKEYIDVVLNFK
jgi:hypothetical protein